MDAALQTQEDVVRRSHALLPRLAEAKRRRLSVSAPARRSDVAFLPTSRALVVIEEHPIVRMFGLRTEEVHRVLERLLVPGRAPAAPSAPARETALHRCRYCVQGVLEDRADCVSCSKCGAVAEAAIERGNPYREFDDQPTRRHFEYTRSQHADELHEWVEHVGGHAMMPHAAMKDASRRLREHPHAGDGLPAAAAALIAATMDYDAKLGHLTRPPSPAGFRCTTCGAKQGNMRSASYHCRSGPRAIRARRRDGGLPRPSQAE